MGIMDDAKNAASGHEDQTDAAIKKGGDVAEDKTGGKYDDQIESGEKKADQAI
jgi:hypothetical protein